MLIIRITMLVDKNTTYSTTYGVHEAESFYDVTVNILL